MTRGTTMCGTQTLVVGKVPVQWTTMLLMYQWKLECQMYGIQTPKVGNMEPQLTPGINQQLIPGMIQPVEDIGMMMVHGMMVLLQPLVTMIIIQEPGPIQLWILTLIQLWILTLSQPLPIHGKMNTSGMMKIKHGNTTQL